MSEGSWLPKTWGEAIPQVFWGVLILGFGLEFCVSILDANYGRALAALVGLLAVLAVLIHQEQLRQRLLNINPNWIAAAFTLFLAAIILSPFVEAKRWPLSAWFQSRIAIIHDPPSAEDIAKATAPIQADLSAATEKLKRMTAPASEDDIAKAKASQAAEDQQKLVSLQSQYDTKLKEAQSHAAASVAPNPRQKIQMDSSKALYIARMLAEYMPSPNYRPGTGMHTTDVNWQLLIANTPDNDDIANLLVALTSTTLHAYRITPPDHSTNLDAPVIPTPPDSPGIILHGDNPLNDKLRFLLSECFIVKTTSRTLDSLNDWFKPGTGTTIVWIEIGKGSPWKDSGGCAH
jgi:hypothetical protein